MKEKIFNTLKRIVHPEKGENIIDAQILKKIEEQEGKITLTLQFPRRNDPFARSLQKNIMGALVNDGVAVADDISLIIEEPQIEKVTLNPERPDYKTIAISSGKGGVGKSSVALNLAVSLSKSGYKIGLLDADLYGPSQPIMNGVTGYSPGIYELDGKEWMLPAEVNGIKLMSIGFFIQKEDALAWRGPMATNALKQLIDQTHWGDIDFLLIDMPPGTGDIHLTVIHDHKPDGAVIVTTPQDVALADVLRGIRMYTMEKVEIPILGIIENMAWFTPDDMPGKKYYIFGKGKIGRLAESENIEILGSIPIVPSIAEDSDGGKPSVLGSETLSDIYKNIGKKIVDKLC